MKRPPATRCVPSGWGLFGLSDNFNAELVGGFLDDSLKRFAVGFIPFIFHSGLSAERTAKIRVPGVLFAQFRGNLFGGCHKSFLSFVFQNIANLTV